MHNFNFHHKICNFLHPLLLQRTSKKEEEKSRALLSESYVNTLGFWDADVRCGTSERQRVRTCSNKYHYIQAGWGDGSLGDTHTPPPGPRLTSWAIRAKQRLLPCSSRSALQPQALQLQPHGKLVQHAWPHRCSPLQLLSEASSTVNVSQPERRRSFSRFRDVWEKENIGSIFIVKQQK